jgi:hypothetical protein
MLSGINQMVIMLSGINHMIIMLSGIKQMVIMQSVMAPYNTHLSIPNPLYLFVLASLCFYQFSRLEANIKGRKKHMMTTGADPMKPLD